MSNPCPTHVQTRVQTYVQVLGCIQKEEGMHGGVFWGGIESINDHFECVT